MWAGNKKIELKDVREREGTVFITVEVHTPIETTQISECQTKITYMVNNHYWQYRDTKLFLGEREITERNEETEIVLRAAGAGR